MTDEKVTATITGSLDVQKWHKLPGNIRVTVDGKEIAQVIEFDTEGGWVRHLSLNDEGQAYVDPKKHDEAATETTHGEVIAEILQ